MHKTADSSITARSIIEVPDMQRQLYFEILDGQQNSFTAETDLNQRKLASTLKWSHYMFTSGVIQ